MRRTSRKSSLRSAAVVGALALALVALLFSTAQRADATGLPLPQSLRTQTIEPEWPKPRGLPRVTSWFTALGAESWYRYQGEPNSGPYAHSNCGPSCVAMAIEWARDGRWVAIRDVRDYIGGTSWTYPSHLQSALDHWGVRNERLASMSAIHDAVTARGSIVIVHLWMHWFTPGSDYLLAYSDPTDHHGRYYAYAQSHWVIVHGISADGQWAICHDPNVWEGDGSYWYAGHRPKGQDRYYRYTELSSSAADYGYQAIEVLQASNTATPTATLSPEPPRATNSPVAYPTTTIGPSMTPTPSRMPRKRLELPLVRKPPLPTRTPTATSSPTASPTSSGTATCTPATLPAPTTTRSATPTDTVPSVATIPVPTQTDEVAGVYEVGIWGWVRVRGTDMGLSDVLVTLAPAHAPTDISAAATTETDGAFSLTASVERGQYLLSCDLPDDAVPFSVSLPPNVALSAVSAGVAQVQVTVDLNTGPIVFSCVRTELTPRRDGGRASLPR